MNITDKSFDPLLFILLEEARAEFSDRPLDLNQRFALIMKSLKPLMCSPLFSESNMNVCAFKINDLFPNLTLTQKTQFETLNNRIKVWNKTRSDPAARFAQFEKLPIYKGKKLHLIEDLLKLLASEKQFYGGLEKLLIPYLHLGKDVVIPLYEANMKGFILQTQKQVENLIEGFPHLEFVLEYMKEKQNERAFVDVKIQIINFQNGYKSIQNDQTQLEKYLIELRTKQNAPQIAVAPKAMSCDISFKEPSERIPSAMNLEKLNELVSHLQSEATLMEKMTLHLISNGKILKLFELMRRNSFEVLIDKQISIGYNISKQDIEKHPTLTKCRFVILRNSSQSPFITLSKIEKKYFKPKALAADLDVLITKSPSLKLKDVFESMKAHVELMHLIQKNDLEIDLQNFIKPINPAHIDALRTPFLHDALHFTQFVESKTPSSDSFNNPKLPSFIECNQPTFEKIQGAWNKNSQHQKQLLQYVKKEIASLKKAKHSNKGKEVKPEPMNQNTSESALTEKKITNIKPPKILKKPIAIAKAIIQGPPKATTVIPKLYKPSSLISEGPIAKGMRNLTTTPPGKPFSHKKSDRVLRWENHPFGKPLTPNLFEDKYTKLPLHVQEKIHLFHALHPAVDLFLHFGIQGRFEKNKRIDIITEIQFNHETFKGVIGYTFSGGNCYHKCFTSSQKDILDLAWEKLQEQEFPELKTVANPLNRKVRYPDLKCYISHDHVGNVIIEDTRRDLVIKLFKT